MGWGEPLAEEPGQLEGLRAGREAAGGVRSEAGGRRFKSWSARHGQRFVLKACDLPSFLTLPFEQVHSSNVRGLRATRIEGVEKNRDRRV